MKSIFKSALIIITAVTFHGCDVVNPPYQNVTPQVTGARKVLVEDYTGHKCGNCPRASKAIYDIKESFGENMIIMAIHAGGFSDPFPSGAPYYTYDFRTPEATELDTDFGISLAGNPNGMINRRMVNGSYIIGSTKWASEAANVLFDQTPVPVKLTINNAYNSSSRELQTSVQSEFFSTLTGTHKLCVFLVEDSIVNWQKDYDVVPNDIEFYTHREVFRRSMNGTYGEQVSNTTEGQATSLNYSYTLPVEWNEEHVSIVTYIYNDATKEIIQVEQQDIK